MDAVGRPVDDDFRRSRHGRDDWNISIKWVTDIRNEAWWQEHIVGGLVSYWVYQHLGNLSPERIAEEGLLAQAVAAGDAGDLLRAWAMSSEEFTPVAGGYPFSFVRHLGDVRLVVVDSRNGRTLAPGERSMIDSEESAWVAQQCEGEIEHLVIATSLPVFVPGGLHGVQQWNEALCDGAWGRIGSRASERLRRALDLEDWAAFDRSFRCSWRCSPTFQNATTRHRRSQSCLVTSTFRMSPESYCHPSQRRVRSTRS